MFLSLSVRPLVSLSQEVEKMSNKLFLAAAMQLCKTTFPSVCLFLCPLRRNVQKNAFYYKNI